jgi:hypothetical protein
MKSPIAYSAFVSLVLTGAAMAVVPKNAPHYSQGPLVTDSPFTSKPVAPIVTQPSNPLGHYGLLGVSPIANGGYRVTLVHKKNPTERIIVDSNKSEKGFRILAVNRVTGNPSATVVQLQLGSQTGTVAFDPKLTAIVSKKPAAPKAAEPPATAPRAGRIRVAQPQN